MAQMPKTAKGEIVREVSPFMKKLFCQQFCHTVQQCCTVHYLNSIKKGWASSKKYLLAELSFYF